MGGRPKFQWLWLTKERDDQKEIQERQRYHGFTKDEVQQMLSQPPTGPEVPQAQQPTETLGNQIVSLGQLPDKVAAAITDVMNRYWGQA